MNGSDPKLSARELLEEAHPALVGLSHWIHANPEVGYEETLAAGWVAEWLTTGGFEVETGAANMPTAIIGRTGPGPLNIAICVEYDALPEVGHACGHNVIAAASVGAGLALASVAEELGLRITVLGTPAEESGGGKLRLIEAGAFDGIHAAMMVHPWPTDISTPRIIAVNQLEVTYTGQEAHAAGFPQHGRNAGDALVIAQTAIGLLRQQLLPTDYVHGIVTRGGDAPNIIPAHTSATFMVRAHDRARMDELMVLVSRCFEAGALATGTEVSIVPGTAYSDMVHDPDLAALYRHNAESLGRVFDDSNSSPLSTDMGDVSHLVPSIHPTIGIESNGAVNHQRAFTDACATPSADKAILDAALAMAWTVIDAAQDDVIRARLLSEALAREAVALVEEADELEQEAGFLEEVAEALAPSDPETAGELALAAILLDTRAEALAEAADERLDEASAIQDEAVLDQVANELANDAEDLVAEGIRIAEASDALADEAASSLEAAAELELEAEQLEEQADAVAGIDAEEAKVLAATAAALAVQAEQLRDEADIDAGDAADLAGTSAFVLAAADDLTDEAAELAPLGSSPTGWPAEESTELSSEAADLMDEAGDLATEATDFAVAALEDVGESIELSSEATDLTNEAEDLAARAWDLTAASDAAVAELVDDASVALEAAEEAAGLEAVADTLAEEAAELSAESAELAAEADALAEGAAAVAASDPDAAEELAATAFVFETRAQETADEAKARLEQALEISADAAVVGELAEVATEAAEDAADEAVEDELLAEELAQEAGLAQDAAEVVIEAAEDAEVAAFNEAVIASVLADEAERTEDLAEVVTEAAEDSADRDQVRVITTHSAWEEEYARMMAGSSDEPVAADTAEAGSAAADETVPAESPWYSSPAEPVAEATDETLTDGPGATDEAVATDEAEPSAPTADTEPVAEAVAEPDDEADAETPLGNFEWIPGGPE